MPILVGAADPTPRERLQEAEQYFASGQYFRTARFAFEAQQEDPGLSGQAYVLAARGLIRAGLKNAASYFVIRAMQTATSAQLRSLLPYLDDMVESVGFDVLRRFVLKHTSADDYPTAERGLLEFLLGRQALLAGQEDEAIEKLSRVERASRWFARARLMRGTALAIKGDTARALADFESCERSARRQSLRVRCIAGQARTLYQMDQFDRAEDQYDRIPKASLEWTDTLFEMAWVAFSRGEYNRSLGRLVSYRSPALQFVHNPEIEVLRAQSFLAMCLYVDAHDVVQEFYTKYAGVGVEIKSLLEKNKDDLLAYYPLGRSALRAKLQTARPLSRVLNRFARSGYFRSLVSEEQALDGERRAIASFASASQAEPGSRGGFPEFLGKILDWRLRSIWKIGGAFIKNSLMDHSKDLVDQLEKIAFIKLELLGRLKDRLERPLAKDGELRGNGQIQRKDRQYYWGFNGEFWNDELGDYVFSLDSQCRG